MPHGFKRDLTQTKAMKENRFLMERGSFVTLPVDGKVHFHLEGSDRSRMRNIVWARSKGKCQNRRCRKPITFDSFEMDHKQGGLSGRCDCLHNLTALCHECHQNKHVHPQFGQSRDSAIRDFKRLYPEGEEPCQPQPRPELNS